MYIKDPPQFVQRLTQPFERFFRLDAAAGLLLMCATVAALAWANSPWSPAYFALWEIPVSAGFGPFHIKKALILWINDGLMAVFFFLVGLEIKRELLAGKLSSPRTAALPAVAALGGMLVPALIYTAFNTGGPGAAGWGIPMATDIAFALGIMALLGPRVPVALKVFLTALAIVDDIGAVVVIALFYSSNISITNILLGGGFLALMFLAGFAGVRSPLVFAVLGIGGLWLSFLLSGVHATIAGVLGALAIPASVRVRSDRFEHVLQEAVARFRGETRGGTVMLSHDQQNTIAAIEDVCEKIQPPLQRLEHRLYPLVMYGIMPLFAFANAGVELSGDALAGAAGPVGAGIFLGLLAGKLIGITGFSYVAVRLGWAALPERSDWRQIIGAALLGGVGFTMSLFIGGLAFTDAGLFDSARIGIFVASLVAGVGGYIVLRLSTPDAADTQAS